MPVATTPGHDSIAVLKDRTLPWSERLSVAERIWSNSTVFVPRKEQILIDWITYSLHSAGSKSEAFTERDTRKAWEVLTQFLECLRKESNQRVDNVALQQWFFKDLLADLGNDSITQLVQKCLHIISSDVKQYNTFQYIPLDLQIQLLEKCCQVISKAEDDEDMGQLSQITDNIINRIREMTSKKNITINILMPVTVRLFEVGISAHTRLESSDRKSNIIPLLYDILMHRDALRHYDKHVTEKPQTNPKQAAKQSFVEILLDAIKKNLKCDEPDTRTKYADVVEKLFESYLLSSSTVKVPMDKFGMLYLLMTLTSDLPDDSLVLTCWASLLRLCGKYDLHEQGSEATATENNKLTRTLISLLSRFGQRHTAGWYNCMTALLDINYKLIEKRLDQVLMACQRTADNESAGDEARDKFLCSLLQTYSKLRQIPTVILAVRDCLLKSDKPQSLSAPVLKCLSAIITDTPSSVCLELISAHFSPLMELTHNIQTTDECMRILCYAEIFHSILYNMKMYDSSVALATREKFVTVMEEMCERLSGVLGEFKDEEKLSLHIPVYMLLMDACCAVISMIHMYTQQSEADQLSASLSMDILEFLNIASDVEKSAKLPADLKSLCTYLRIQLMCHSIDHRQAAENSEPVSQTLSEITDIWSGLRECSKNKSGCSMWDEKVLSVNERNVDVAIFTSLSQSTVPLLVSMEGDKSENTRRFVGLLVDFALETSTQESSECITKYLNCWRCTELAELPRSLLYQTTQHLNSAFASTSSQETHQAKKRRKSVTTKHNNLINYFSCVSQYAAESQTKDNSTEKLLTYTGSALDDTDVVLTSAQIDSVRGCATLIQCIPVTNKLGGDYSCMMTSLSLILSKLLQNHNEPKKPTLGEPVSVRLTEVFLASLQFQSRDIWNHLNIESVLNVLNEGSNDKNSSHQQLLSEAIVNSLVTNQTLFNKYISFLDKTFEEFLDCIVTQEAEPKGKESSQKNRGLLLALAQSLSQAMADQAGKPQQKWMNKCTKKLVSSLKTKNIVSEHSRLSEDLLTWVSSVIDQCADVTDDITKVTVHQQTGNNNGQGCSDDRNEAVYLYLTSWFTSSVHNSEVYDTSTVWHKIILSKAATQSSQHEKLVNAFFSAIENREIDLCLINLHEHIHNDLTGHLPGAIKVWSILLDKSINLGKEKEQTVNKYRRQLVSESYRFICELSCLIQSAGENNCVTRSQTCLLELINLLTDVISKGKTYTDASHISAILSSLQLIEFSSVYTVHDLALPMSSIQRLIRSVLLHHESTAGQNTPQIIQISNNLAKALINNSSQIEMQQQVGQMGADLVKMESDMLMGCQELSKIYALMSNYPKMFGKMIGFMLADVISLLQSVTLLPSIKKSLHLALNGLMDLVDEYCDLMLKTNMPEAQREMYKSMYEQYNQYHKYSGKV